MEVHKTNPYSNINKRKSTDLENITKEVRILKHKEKVIYYNLQFSRHTKNIRKHS